MLYGSAIANSWECCSANQGNNRRKTVVLRQSVVLPVSKQLPGIILKHCCGKAMTHVHIFHQWRCDVYPNVRSYILGSFIPHFKNLNIFFMLYPLLFHNHCKVALMASVYQCYQKRRKPLSKPFIKRKDRSWLLKPKVSSCFLWHLLTVSEVSRGARNKAGNTWLPFKIKRHGFICVPYAIMFFLYEIH